MTQTYEDAMAEAFPAIEAGIQPFGSRVLVQIRTPKTKTTSGIIIDTGSRDTEKWNTQVAKVVSHGPVAYRNRNTLEPWPEGGWAHPGDYVRVPKYGGDRWEVATPDGGNALFVIFNDLDIIGKVDGDPLAVRAFI